MSRINRTFWLRVDANNTFSIVVDSNIVTSDIKNIAGVRGFDVSSADTFTYNLVCSQTQSLATDPMMLDSQMIAAFYPTKY